MQLLRLQSSKGRAGFGAGIAILSLQKGNLFTSGNSSCSFSSSSYTLATQDFSYSTKNSPKMFKICFFLVSVVPSLLLLTFLLKNLSLFCPPYFVTHFLCVWKFFKILTFIYFSSVNITNVNLKLF